ncbi:MAG: hypothetical protein ABJA71_14715 [Ginsengibacter sp.]
MHRNRKRFFIGFPLIITAGILLLGLVVMLLWNAILQPVLNVHALTYWQAVGIFILCKILFGSFRRRGSSQRERSWRGSSHWRQKWMNMNDDERAKFREEWKKRCRPPDREQS